MPKGNSNITDKTVYRIIVMPTDDKKLFQNNEEFILKYKVAATHRAEVCDDVKIQEDPGVSTGKLKSHTGSVSPQCKCAGAGPGSASTGMDINIQIRHVWDVVFFFCTFNCDVTLFSMIHLPLLFCVSVSCSCLDKL
ncbi:unnamed protein product [Knipowitschia caucasica]